MVEPQILREAVTALDAAGFQCHFHAIGDGAIRLALDALQAARAKNGPSPHRPHLAHIELIHPDDLPRFAQLGAVANMQPFWAMHEAQMRDLRIPVLGPSARAGNSPFAASWTPAPTWPRAVIGR